MGIDFANTDRFSAKEHRRNKNLSCAYLNSHLSLRDEITDHQAYVNIQKYIASHGISNSDFVRDIYVVFVSKTDVHQELGEILGLYDYIVEEPFTSIRDFPSPGLTHHVFSDDGFQEYLRDSKYSSATSNYAVDSMTTRSNQLYHATGGFAVGFQVEPYLAFDAVRFHEMGVTGWEFGESPANGGSMEDLLLNYLTAYNGARLKANTLSINDIISEHDSLGLDINNKNLHITDLTEMFENYFISEEHRNELQKFIVEN